MIHYHGTPIWPLGASASVLTGGHAFVSFERPEQLGVVVDVCQSFALDNGAFSAWNRGQPVTDWSPFYAWAAEAVRIPSCDFAVLGGQQTLVADHHGVTIETIRPALAHWSK